MKIVILGANGMIGHKLSQKLRDHHHIIPVVRNPSEHAALTRIFSSNLLTVPDAKESGDYRNLIHELRPDVVINCIGVIKQKHEAENSRAQIYLNALFPHHLAEICDETGSRLIHFSTDCVFSGIDGSYSEESVSDATDLYGRTKFLGEVDAPHCLTLRTSVIGHELFSTYSLVEWFLNRPAGTNVHGYTHAIYSGFPTVTLASILNTIITDYPGLNGLFHLSSRPISKFDLLGLVADIYKVDNRIIPDDRFVCDRSLNSDKLRSRISYQPPTWEELVKEMYMDYLITGYRIKTKGS